METQSFRWTDLDSILSLSSETRGVFTKVPHDSSN